MTRTTLFLSILLGCGTPAAPATPRSPLPPPTGSSVVGRRTILIETAGHTGDQALVLEVWYPAAAAGGDRAVYTRKGSGYATAVTQLLGVPAQEMPSLEGVPTNAYRDAPIAPGHHALVLFAPGWGGPASQNTILAEELASHGYVFASLGITGQSVLVERPDGKNIPIDPAQVERILGEAGEQASHFQAWMEATDPAKRKAERDAFVAGSVHARETAQWWTDTLVELATKPTWVERDAVLRGAVATDRLAIVGMSFGGGVAAAACGRVAGCAVSVNLDGFAPGASDVAPTRPHLIVEAPPGGASDDLLAAAPPVWRLRVAGTTHLDYTDMVELAPKSSLHGTIEPARMTGLLRSTVRTLVDCFVHRTGSWSLPTGKGLELSKSPAAADLELSPAGTGPVRCTP